MNRLLLLAKSLAVVLASHAQTKDKDRQFKEKVKKARSLKLRNCEMNDGTKGRTLPNREPMGKLPVYRCSAGDAFGKALATFTQIPDGSGKKEAVELCNFGEMSSKG